VPDGVVQWFDAGTGDAAIVRGGHVFRAAGAEVEPAARRAGARVHFDIRRDEGVEAAVAVRLRRGTRVSPRQGRFGTLAGAHRPDTKGAAPFAHPHPETGLALAAHPLEVARAWARRVADGDVDEALLLYSPTAVVHAEGDAVAGRSRLHAYLGAVPVRGSRRIPDVRGEAGTVLVSWAAEGPDDPGWSAHCRIEHGQIAEQWVDETPPAARTVVVEGAHGPLTTELVTRGDVHDDAVAYARERIIHLTRMIDEPVLAARIKLTHAPDPARARPAIAQATLDVNGEAVRAHVAAHELREAIDLLQRRLLDKLEHRRERREAERRSAAVPEPGEWRHRDLPAVRPDYFDRPAEDRQLVRHKTFATDELTPDEAAFDMDQLDFDFYLFEDLASGQDSLLDRTADGTYRLTRLNPSPADPGPTAVPLQLTGTASPQLTLGEAIERLDSGGERFVFFAEATTGRGAVVYRRYDGHYGVITPA